MRRSNPYADAENLARQTQGWLETIRESVPPRPRLTLQPSHCGLLIIDMLHYFAHPEGRCFLPAAGTVTPRIARLLSAWREWGGTVAFTQHGHTGPQDLGMLGRFFSDYIRAGEPEAEIVSALAPLAGEKVFRKTTYDAFLGTELQAYLEHRACRQVLVTGVLTHMCCETTARSAFCRGFEVYVPVDAVASSCEELHLGSLLAMADAVAIAMSTEEVLARCDAMSA